MNPRTTLFAQAGFRNALCTALLCAAAPLGWAQVPTLGDASPIQLDALEVVADVLDRDDSRQKVVSTATKMAMEARDVPQTVNTLEMSKYKVYGLNDLSVLLDGTPGVDTSYDMRSDGITIRGFAADSNDVYRDGVRNAGQIRRGTANVERIEIVKGPASVLYGRGLGGGVVNLISKQARFDAVSSIGVRGGSWENRGTTVDVNQVVTNNIVIRLTTDFEQSDSFRRGISNRNRMFSPSILIDNKQGLSWLAQYTYDKVWRRPDRAPAFDALPDGVSSRTAYAHPDDFVEDIAESIRSELNYAFNSSWSVKWTAAWNESAQDFDHLYAGRYNPTTGKMTFTRAWQETSNTNFINTIDINGYFNTGPVSHTLLFGVEAAREKRLPNLATSGASSDPGLLYPWEIDPYDPVFIEPKTPRGDAKTSNRHRATSEALYIQDLMSLGEQWKVLVGGRFDRFHFRSHNLITDKQRGYRGDTFSPRVGVIWQPSGSQSLYASYSKNFAPYGGRGLMSVSVDDTAVYDADPQYSRQYEVGIKSEWLSERLSSQLSVYELELYNIRYRPDPDNEPFLWAVRGSERSRGAELSLTGKILEGGLYVRSGVGLQEAKIIEDKSTPANEGRHKRGIARKTGNLFLRYAPKGPLYAEIGVTYKGPIYNDLANTSQRSGYTRWDASVGWRVMPWTVTLAVTNLTGKDYWRSSSMPGAPRSFLLSANYVF